MKKIYGIIGNPLAQSASPAFFNKKFATEGIDAEYLPFELQSIEELPAVLEKYPTLSGFNVTIPYKLQIKDYLEGISDEAREIDAVNVVKVCVQIVLLILGIQVFVLLAVRWNYNKNCHVKMMKNVHLFLQ